MATGRDASYDSDRENLFSNHSSIPLAESDATKVYTIKHPSTSTRRLRTWSHPFRRWWTWLFTDTWILEYASLALAIAALASIGIVLFVYRERNQSDWKFSISLNTVLSVLATIMKGTMMLPVGSCLGQLKWAWYYREKRALQNFQVFDEASRGPWGSTRLLYLLRFWHIASIGCVVTLLALALDAFVQQSVDYPSRNANASGVAAVPFSQWYDRAGETTAVTTEPEQSMKAAFYDGAFIANISQTSASISPQCPTGNCTFPDYASLGICSQCRKINSLIGKRCVNYDESFANPIGFNSKGCIDQTSLPNGLFLRDAKIIDYIAMYAGDFHTNLLNTKELDVYQTSLVNVSILILNTNPYKPDVSGLVNASAVLAYDCVLSLCVKTYSSQMSQGRFTEDVQDEYYISDLYSSNSPNVTIPQGHLPAGSNLTFAIGYHAWVGLTDMLSKQLNGTGSIAGGSQNWDTDVVSAIFVNGAMNVNQTMTSIATAMTNNMRQQSGTVIPGQATTPETYIHVRWLWLLLPLAMVILATVFLVLTIRQSQRWNIPSWRSSALATMIHGVRTVEADALGTGSDQKERFSELEEWAESVDVRLRRTWNGGGTYDLVFAGR
ncbi:hypothetical protein MMC30_009323 [Trapelia coarctata]|nr:hypothetical protein [Trapelia coarctata]